jgi:hypothetical protein
MLPRLAAVVVLFGCAQARDASHGLAPDGHPKEPLDGPTVVTPDGHAPTDAPSGATTITLTQTHDSTVAAGIGVACGTALGTAANAWYRDFRLSDYGVTSTFHVTSVAFWTDVAIAASGGHQPGTIKLGTFGGAVDASKLTGTITSLATTQIQIADADASMGASTPSSVSIDADVPAGANLVVELDVPDGETTGNFFYLGVSAGGESHPGYIKSSACSVSTPTSLASQGHGDNAILMTVTGTY